MENLNVAGRMTICNMAVEMGAKTAYMQPNRDVLDYVSARAVRPFEVQYTDPGYEYAETHVFDVSAMEPQLACPHSVENVHPLREVTAEKDGWVTLYGASHKHIEYLDQLAKDLNLR